MPIGAFIQRMSMRPLQFIGARVDRSKTAQTIATGSSLTAISNDTVEFDTGGFWNAGTPTRLTIPTGLDGYYIVNYWAAYVSNGTGTRVVGVRLNGSTVLSTSENNGVSGGDTWNDCQTSLVKLAAGDYLEAVTAQTSGGNLNISPGLLAIAYMGRG